MSRKRLFFAMCIAAFALSLGTTDAEARSRYGRRSNQQNGCRQSSNYGRGNTRTRARYYNTTGHGYSVSGHGQAGVGNSGHYNY